MKRHAALADLARDHFHALVCVQRIRKAQTGPEKLEAARALADLWNEDLVHHFREEEEVLLPLLSRHGLPTENPDVRRMLDDHAYLRDGLRRLEAALNAAEDCHELAELLGARLAEHARLEDRIVFGYLEQCLSEAELAELGRLSHQFRARWARPTGPVKATCPPTSSHPTRPVAAHFILFVNQQAASRDFYQALLSLEPRLDVPGMTEFELGTGAVLGLMPRDSIQALLGLESGHHSSELYLVVPDPKAMATRALERGACVASPLTARSWGAEVIYLHDPDGHILALADRET